MNDDDCFWDEKQSRLTEGPQASGSLTTRANSTAGSRIVCPKPINIRRSAAAGSGRPSTDTAAAAINGVKRLLRSLRDETKAEGNGQDGKILSSLQPLRTAVASLQGMLASAPSVAQEELAGLWEVSKGFAEAAVSEARHTSKPVSSTAPGVSGALHDMGIALYDTLCVTEERTCGPDGVTWQALLHRAEHLYQMGRAWMSVHKLQQAGVSLARAREALGRLAAHPGGPMGGAPGEPPADGWEQCLRVELGVLVESLRLSLAEGHKALNANLRLQLLRLACSRTTPGRLASGAVMACAAALLDAAASRLAAPPSAAADQPPAASGLGGGAARAAGAADGAQCREALGLLRDALACLEQLLEGEADGDGDAISEASADEEWGGAGGRAAGGDGGSKGSRFTEVEVMEVCAMRQQVFKLIISTCNRSKAHEEALSYVREYGRTQAQLPALLHRAAGGDESPPEIPGPPPPLPLDVLMLSLQAHMGAGRTTEAAAVLEQQIQPHEDCTPDVIKGAISRLLLEPPLPEPRLLAALPHVTACLHTCLALCGEQPGPGGGTPVWGHRAGAELVMLVVHALAMYQGPACEQQLLALLAHDECVAAVTRHAPSRDRCHRLLYAQGAAAFQQRAHAAAARLFSAALLYGSGGGSEKYCRTARMLSNCYAAMGEVQRAVGYLDLAEAQEPGTAAHVLLRLRLTLMRGKGGAKDGGAVRHGVGGDEEEAGGEAAGVQAEAVRLVERLLLCCDFEPPHLTAAYDIAMRAKSHAVALAATQLAMRRHDGPAAAAGAKVDVARPPPDIGSTLALGCNSLSARMAMAVASESPGNCDGAGVRDGEFATAAELPRILSRAVCAAAVQDLRWLCSRLDGGESAGGAHKGLKARHVPALSWLLDVAVRLATEALRTATAASDGGAGRPSWRGWRSITSGVIDCARQLAAALKGAQAAAAASAAASQAAVTPEQVQGKLQPAVLALAAAMLDAHVQDGGGAADQERSSVVAAAVKLLDMVEQQLQAGKGVEASRRQPSHGNGGSGGKGLLPLQLQLRFVAATLQRNERQQKAVLQALVETPAVCAAQLEALAELCLAPGRPWRCPAIAAGLLGFTLRRALAGSRSQPDVDVAARAIRRLHELGSRDVQWRVCERACEVAASLQQAAAAAAAAATASAPPTEQRLAVQYPQAELQLLWAACINAATATRGWGDARHGGNPAVPQEVHRMVELALRLSDHLGCSAEMALIAQRLRSAPVTGERRGHKVPAAEICTATARATETAAGGAGLPGADAARSEVAVCRVQPGRGGGEERGVKERKVACVAAATGGEDDAVAKGHRGQRQKESHAAPQTTCMGAAAAKEDTDRNTGAHEAGGLPEPVGQPQEKAAALEPCPAVPEPARDIGKYTGPPATLSRPAGERAEPCGSARAAAVEVAVEAMTAPAAVQATPLADADDSRNPSAAVAVETEELDPPKRSSTMQPSAVAQAAPAPVEGEGVAATAQQGSGQLQPAFGATSTEAMEVETGPLQPLNPNGHEGAALAMGNSASEAPIMANAAGPSLRHHPPADHVASATAIPTDPVPVLTCTSAPAAEVQVPAVQYGAQRDGMDWEREGHGGVASVLEDAVVTTAATELQPPEQQQAEPPHPHASGGAACATASQQRLPAVAVPAPVPMGQPAAADTVVPATSASSTGAEGHQEVAGVGSGSPSAKGPHNTDPSGTDGCAGGAPAPCGPPAAAAHAPHAALAASRAVGAGAGAGADHPPAPAFQEEWTQQGLQPPLPPASKAQLPEADVGPTTVPAPCGDGPAAAGGTQSGAPAAVSPAALAGRADDAGQGQEPPAATSLQQACSQADTPSSDSYEEPLGEQREADTAASPMPAAMGHEVHEPADASQSHAGILVRQGSQELAAFQCKAEAASLHPGGVAHAGVAAAAQAAQAPGKDKRAAVSQLLQAGGGEGGMRAGCCATAPEHAGVASMCGTFCTPDGTQPPPASLLLQQPQIQVLVDDAGASSGDRGPEAGAVASLAGRAALGDGGDKGPAERRDAEPLDKAESAIGHGGGDSGMRYVKGQPSSRAAAGASCADAPALEAKPEYKSAEADGTQAERKSEAAVEVGLEAGVVMVGLAQQAMQTPPAAGAEAEGSGEPAAALAGARVNGMGSGMGEQAMSECAQDVDRVPATPLSGSKRRRSEGEEPETDTVEKRRGGAGAAETAGTADGEEVAPGIGGAGAVGDGGPLPQPAAEGQDVAAVVQVMTSPTPRQCAFLVGKGYPRGSDAEQHAEGVGEGRVQHGGAVEPGGEAPPCSSQCDAEQRGASDALQDGQGATPATRPGAQPDQVAVAEAAAAMPRQAASQPDAAAAPAAPAGSQTERDVQEDAPAHVGMKRTAAQAGLDGEEQAGEFGAEVASGSRCTPSKRPCLGGPGEHMGEGCRDPAVQEEGAGGVDTEGDGTQPADQGRGDASCAEGSVVLVAAGTGASAAAAGASAPAKTGGAGTSDEHAGGTAVPAGADVGPAAARCEHVVGKALGGGGDQVEQVGVQAQLPADQQPADVRVPQTVPNSEPLPCPLVVLCGSSFADDVDALLLDDE